VPDYIFLHKFRKTKHFIGPLKRVKVRQIKPSSFAITEYLRKIEVEQIYDIGTADWFSGRRHSQRRYVARFKKGIVTTVIVYKMVQHIIIKGPVGFKADPIGIILSDYRIITIIGSIQKQFNILAEPDFLKSFKQII
jgi:hypothetical protein